MNLLTGEASVLVALAEGPAGGVDLMERARTLSGNGSRLGAGALYPLLRRLEGRGLVRAWRETKRTRVGRPRRFHELTAEGVLALERQRQRLQVLGAPGTPAALPAAAVRRMRSNLRRAFRVSALARRLRVAVAG